MDQIATKAGVSEHVAKQAVFVIQHAPDLADEVQQGRLATRIQLRAVRRCGELLKAIAPRDTAGPPIRKGDHTITRTQAAADAGLSEHQKRTALRVAAIPEEEFELTVESAAPTVTAMAERGTRKPA